MYLMSFLTNLMQKTLVIMISEKSLQKQLKKVKLAQLLQISPVLIFCDLMK